MAVAARSNQRWRAAAGIITALAALVACEKRPAPRTERPANPDPAPAVASGEKVYADYCAVCHMASGHGVPNFQPALVGSDIVAGDRQRLENVIRAGSAVLKDRDNPFGTEMPPFGFLSAEEVDALIDYLKQNFVANDA